MVKASFFPFLKEGKLSLTILLILIIIAPLYPLYLDSNFSFGNLDSCDGWRYFGLTHLLDKLDQLKIQHFYLDDRLPAILPKWLLYKLPLNIAHYLDYFLSYYFLLLSAFFASKHLWNTKVGIYIVLLLAVSPLTYGSLSTDYLSISPMVYSFVSLAFFALPRNKRNLVLGSAFYMIALHSNLRIILYNFFILIYVFIELDKRDRVNFIKTFLITGVGTTVLLGSLSLLILDREFLFFKDQLMQIFIPLPVWWDRSFLIKLQRNPAVIIYITTFFIGIISIFKKNNIKFVIPIVFQCVTLLIYSLAGGDHFANTNYLWSLLILFFVLGPQIKNLNLLKSNYNLEIILFLLFLFLSFLQDFSLQIYFFEFIPGFQFLLPIIICGLLYFLNKFNKVFSLFLIVLIMSFLRPEYQTSTLWTKDDHPLKNYETYKFISNHLKSLGEIQFNKAPYFIAEVEEKTLKFAFVKSIYKCNYARSLSFDHLDVYGEESLLNNHPFILIGEKDNTISRINMTLKKWNRYLSPKSVMPFYDDEVLMVAEVLPLSDINSED